MLGHVSAQRALTHGALPTLRPEYEWHWYPSRKGIKTVNGPLSPVNVAIRLETVQFIWDEWICGAQAT